MVFKGLARGGIARRAPEGIPAILNPGEIFVGCTDPAALTRLQEIAGKDVRIFPLAVDGEK
jgi:hypothetical protein